LGEKFNLLDLKFIHVTLPGKKEGINISTSKVKGWNCGIIGTI
jgi:hypothetical protein